MASALSLCHLLINLKVISPNCAAQCSNCIPQQNPQSLQYVVNMPQPIVPVQGVAVPASNNRPCCGQNPSQPNSQTVFWYGSVGQGPQNTEQLSNFSGNNQPQPLYNYYNPGSLLTTTPPRLPLPNYLSPIAVPPSTSQQQQPGFQTQTPPPPQQSSNYNPEPYQPSGNQPDYLNVNTQPPINNQPQIIPSNFNNNNNNPSNIDYNNNPSNFDNNNPSNFENNNNYPDYDNNNPTNFENNNNFNNPSNFNNNNNNNQQPGAPFVPPGSQPYNVNNNNNNAGYNNANPDFFGEASNTASGPGNPPQNFQGNPYLDSPNQPGQIGPNGMIVSSVQYQGIIPAGPSSTAQPFPYSTTPFYSSTTPMPFQGSSTPSYQNTQGVPVSTPIVSSTPSPMQGSSTPYPTNQQFQASNQYPGNPPDNYEGNFQSSTPGPYMDNNQQGFSSTMAPNQGFQSTMEPNNQQGFSSTMAPNQGFQSTGPYNDGFQSTMNPNMGYQGTNQGFQSTMGPNQGFQDQNQGFSSTMAPNQGYQSSMGPNQGFQSTMAPNQGFQDQNQGFSSTMAPNQGFQSTMGPNQGYQSTMMPNQGFQDPNQGFQSTMPPNQQGFQSTMGYQDQNQGYQSSMGPNQGFQSTMAPNNQGFQSTMAPNQGYNDGFQSTYNPNMAGSNYQQDQSQVMGPSTTPPTRTSGSSDQYNTAQMPLGMHNGQQYQGGDGFTPQYDIEHNMNTVYGRYDNNGNLLDSNAPQNDQPFSQDPQNSAVTHHLTSLLLLAGVFYLL